MKSDSIVYRRYANSEDEIEDTHQLITCFQRVFADRPWNEWKKCQVCKSHWGLHEKDFLEKHSFMHCGKLVVDYWPTETVRNDLAHEISKESSAWLAIDNDQVVGFCWGYPATIEYLEKRLNIPLKEKFESIFGPNQKIAYQDELGVLSSYRGKKVAKRLFHKRHQDFMSRGLNVGLVRTRRSPEPSVTYLWFTKRFGYRVIGEYPENDGRVVLAQSLLMI